VQIVKSGYDACDGGNAGKGWNCTQKELDGCISKQKGMKVDGNCPKSACKEFGRCGTKKVPASSRTSSLRRPESLFLTTNNGIMRSSSGYRN